MPIVFTNARDPACPIIFANDSLLSLTGHDRAELLGESIFSLLAQDADAGVLASIKKGFQRGSSIEREVKCRRRDGTDFWATLFASPVLDPQGKIIRRFKFEVQLPVTC
jgi:PAS domain S-box-containing protein